MATAPSSSRLPGPQGHSLRFSREASRSKGSASSTGLSSGASPKIRSILNIAELLARIGSKNLRINPDKLKQLEQDIDKRIAAADRAAQGVILATLRELKSNTPVATGASRAGWHLAVKNLGSRKEYSIRHDDKEQIDRLNYGTKPHLIRPKHGLALRFSVGGTTVFAKSVQHPGTTGLGFVDRARDRMRTKILTVTAQKL